MLLKRRILCYHLNVFGDAHCGVASARTPLHGGRAHSPLRQTGAGFPARSSIRTESLRSAGVPFRIVKSRPFGLQSRPYPRRNEETGCGRRARFKTLSSKDSTRTPDLAPDRQLPVTWLPHPPIKTDARATQ